MDRLHRGEQDAILLAEAVTAERLIIDDLEGRRAVHRGLPVIGTLGLIAQAARRNPYYRGLLSRIYHRPYLPSGGVRPSVNRFFEIRAFGYPYNAPTSWAPDNAAVQDRKCRRHSIPIAPQTGWCVRIGMLSTAVNEFTSPSIFVGVRTRLRPPSLLQQA